MQVKRPCTTGHSPFHGVSYNCQINKKWVAQIYVNGKTIYIGSFYTEEQAALAYDKAAREHFGESAKTNFEVDGVTPVL